MQDRIGKMETELGKWEKDSMWELCNRRKYNIHVGTTIEPSDIQRRCCVLHINDSLKQWLEQIKI